MPCACRRSLDDLCEIGHLGGGLKIAGAARPRSWLASIWDRKPQRIVRTASLKPCLLEEICGETPPFFALHCCVYRQRR